MSDGRKEHRRKLIAANAAVAQAAFQRDGLEQLAKNKRETELEHKLRESAIRDAARTKALEIEERNAKARKVFVAGDIRGNLPKLLTTVEAQMAKVGAFDMLLSVGSFFTDGDDDASGMGAYLKGEKEVPVESYFVDAGPALVHASPQGRTLCENLHFLGGYGVKEISGLRVAFLSGRYNRDTYDTVDVDFVGDSFTSRAVKELQKLVQDDRKQRGIDILLTCGWPTDLDRNVQDQANKPPELDDGQPWQLSCVQPLADLSRAIEPRYHLFGAADVFYQRPPFQAPRRQHVCRCIGLGKVGSAGKQRKWLHALSLSPMRYMKDEDLKQKPPNATPCPFSAGDKRPAEDALPESFGAKRRAVAAEVDADLPERAVSALLSGDLPTYEKLKSALQGAVTASGCATKPKEAEPDKAKKQDAVAPDCPASMLLPKEEKKVAPEPEPEEMTFDQRLRLECAKDFLKKTPKEGTVRFNFDKEGPLGLRLSRDVPPWILEVRDGSLAAKKAPRVPVGGVVLAVNGYELNAPDNAGAIAGLGKRPCILDVEWPDDQAKPMVNRA